MKLKLMPLFLLAGGSLFAQDYYDGDRYEQRRDLHEDYRDIGHDYAQLNRLRNDVARDQYQLDRAWQRGDERAAGRIARDLARDQRSLDALQADINRDHRDIREDHRDLNRGYWRER